MAAPGLRFVSNSRDRHSGPVSPVQTGGAVIDADDLPPDMKRFFDALVSAEAAFKAELENLLKKQGHTPDDTWRKHMPDNLEKRAPQDQSRISLKEPYEVQFWCDKFNVSKERLSEAVRKVGNSASGCESTTSEGGAHRFA